MGSVVKAYGLAGEVIVLPETDHVARFARGGRVFTGTGSALTVKSNAPGKRGWRIRFEEIADREAASALVGGELFIDSSARRRLARNEFWADQLTGLRVQDRDGGDIGRVVGVDDSTSQPRLVVATPGGEVEVPFVEEWVPEVNLEAGYLVVTPIPGLFD